MILSLEEKFAIVAVLLIATLIGGALFCTHLIDAGKAEEKAAVFQAEQKDEEKALKIETAWKSQLTAAQNARAKELADAQTMALKPYVVSVSKYTLRASLPANSAAPAASASPAAGGGVCSGLVPGSSGEMRSFNDAKSADQLIADYRDLYNSWPK